MAVIAYFALLAKNQHISASELSAVDLDYGSARDHLIASISNRLFEPFPCIPAAVAQTQEREQEQESKTKTKRGTKRRLEEESVSGTIPLDSHYPEPEQPMPVSDEIRGTPPMNNNYTDHETPGSVPEATPLTLTGISVPPNPPSYAPSHDQSSQSHAHGIPNPTEQAAASVTAPVSQSYASSQPHQPYGYGYGYGYAPQSLGPVQTLTAVYSSPNQAPRERPELGGQERPYDQSQLFGHSLTSPLQPVTSESYGQVTMHSSNQHQHQREPQSNGHLMVPAQPYASPNQANQPNGSIALQSLQSTAIRTLDRPSKRARPSPSPSSSGKGPVPVPPPLSQNAENGTSSSSSFESRPATQKPWMLGMNMYAADPDIVLE